MANNSWADLDIWNVPRPTSEERRRIVGGVSYRPTLVVGIGGTGCKLVQKMKRLVDESFAAGPAEAFQFLSLDIDVQGSPGQDAQLGPDIFHNIARPNIPIKAIIDKMEAYHGLHAYLSNWWPRRPGRSMNDPDKPYRPLTQDIVAGAQAVRPVGRFALWRTANEVLQYLQGKWGAARNARRANEDTAATSTGKVYLVCSLAGGTGSGMFLDVAYMLRHITENAGFPVCLTGVLLMDSTPFNAHAPNQLVRDRMKANVYAAISELDYYMNREPVGGEPVYEFAYSDNLCISSREHPFDLCYLLSVTNENGLQLRNLDDFCNMVAEAIYLEMASPMAAKGRSVLDNVENLASSVSFPMGDKLPEEERRLAYSSLAVASLTYDRNWTARYCASKMAFDALTDLMGFTPGAALPAITPTATLEAMRLGIDDLPGLDLRGCASRLVGWLSKRAGERSADGRAAGLATAHIELRAVPKLVEDLMARAAKEVEQAQRERTTLQTKMDGLQQQLNVIGSNRKQQAAADQLRADLGEAQEREKVVTATLRKWQIASKPPAGQPSKSVLPDFLAYTQNLEQLLRRIIDDWRLHSRLVSNRLENFAKEDSAFGSHPLAFHTLRAVGLQNLINIFMDPERSSVQQAITKFQEQTATAILMNPAETDLGDATRQLYDRILAAVLQSPEIRDRNENTLFSVLGKCELAAEEEDDGGVDSAVKRLQASAAPFWKVRDDIFPEANQIAAINLVGFEDIADSDGSPAQWAQRLPVLLGQASAVAHGIPDKLILLQTRHGAPAYAIVASSPDVQTTYDTFQQNWEKGLQSAQPVHVRHDWCRGELDDMDPTHKLRKTRHVTRP